MPQSVVFDHPPNYDEIAAVFRIWDRRDVIFSWGDVIYNPYALTIPGQLLAHEAVHGARQTHVEENIRAWWDRYMSDLNFRFEEETLAHRAEYQYIQQHGNRQERRRALKTIAGRLAGPLYGRLCTPQQARNLIGADHE